jgi:hypothetical protein
LVQNRILVGKRRYAVDMFVCSVEIGVANVSKALMPEEAFSTSVELVQMKFLDNRRVGAFGMIVERTEESIFGGSRFGDGLARGRRGCL